MRLKVRRAASTLSNSCERRLVVVVSVVVDEGGDRKRAHTLAVGKNNAGDLLAAVGRRLFSHYFRLWRDDEQTRRRQSAAAIAYLASQRSPLRRPHRVGGGGSGDGSGDGSGERAASGGGGRRRRFSHSRRRTRVRRRSSLTVMRERAGERVSSKQASSKRVDAFELLRLTKFFVCIRFDYNRLFLNIQDQNISERFYSVCRREGRRRRRRWRNTCHGI